MCGGGGGEGSVLDNELQNLPVLTLLVRLSETLIARYVDGVEQDPTNVSLTIAVACVWGKHRSRFVVPSVQDWVEDTFEHIRGLLCVQHLREGHRRHEVDYAVHMMAQGIRLRRAMTSAKALRSRRRRGPFETIKWSVYEHMVSAGCPKHWIDVLKYPPNTPLLEWATKLLPFRAQPHSAHSVPVQALERHLWYVGHAQVFINRWRTTPIIQNILPSNVTSIGNAAPEQQVLPRRPRKATP